MHEKDEKTSYATCLGLFDLPELSNEEAENWEVRITWGEDKQGLQKMLE